MPKDVAAVAFEKLKKVEEVVNKYIFERVEVVHTSILAMVSYLHHFQLGPPGCGKSFLSRVITSAVTDAEVFYQMMHRMMVPDDLFGPRSPTAYKQDRWERAIEKYLPTADYAILEELFKTGSTSTTPLLDVLNERNFKNGTDLLNVPLKAAFASSNELPSEDNLAALWERLTFRHQVDYIVDRENFEGMLKAARNRVKVPVDTVGLTLTDIEAAHEHALSNVDDGSCAYDVLWEIRHAMNEEGLKLDDRQAEWLLNRVVRVEAALNGHDEIQASDFSVIQHCLWGVPSDIPVVRRIVLKISNPVAEQANRFVDDAQKVLDELVEFSKGASREDTKSKAFEVSDILEDALKKIDEKATGSSGSAQAEFQSALKKVELIQRQALGYTGYKRLTGSAA